jgi:hypothetical protein
MPDETDHPAPWTVSSPTSGLLSSVSYIRRQHRPDLPNRRSGIMDQPRRWLGVNRIEGGALTGWLIGAVFPASTQSDCRLVLQAYAPAGISPNITQASSSRALPFFVDHFRCRSFQINNAASLTTRSGCP